MVTPMARIMAVINVLSLLCACNHTTQSSLDTTAIEEALNQQIASVETLLNNMQRRIDALLNSKTAPAPIYSPNCYQQQNGEFLTDHQHCAETNFFVPNHHTITPDLLRYLILTEHLEDVFRNNRNTVPGIGWQYVLDFKHGAMRVYPWTNPQLITAADLEWNKFQFYLQAKGNHDANLVQCTKRVGNDTGGLGKIVICTKTIVHKDRPYGLVGIDLTINPLFDGVRRHLGHDARHFGFIIYNGAEVVKPLFLDDYKNANITLADFSVEGHGKAYILHGERFTTRLRDLQIKHFDFRLLELTRAKDKK